MSLREIVLAIWHGRMQIVVAIGVWMAGAIGYSLLAEDIYRAEALVQPREEQQLPGSLGGVLTQLGGVAELAGLSLGGASDRGIAIAALKSRTVIEAFIRDEKLLPKLYSSQWDSESARWTDPEDAPTVWKAYEDFREDVLLVTEDRSTGLVTVAVEWKDPTDAQRWVTELVARTNSYLRTKAIQEAERNLEYLQKELRSVGQVEIQRGVYALVEAELKKLMLAKGGDEFAFRTIDPAVVPEDSERPERILIVGLSALLGALVGGMWVLARRAWLEAA